MARRMSKAPTHAYRAVLVWEFANGETYTEYQGPYWRAQDAKGQVSHARHYSRWSSYTLIDAWVESTPLGDWKRHA